MRSFGRHAAGMGELKQEEWARWRGLFSEQARKQAKHRRVLARAGAASVAVL